MSRNLIALVNLLALLAAVHCEADDDDANSKYRMMMGSWIQNAMFCKKEMDDSGTDLNLMACMVFYDGNGKIDSSAKEYDNCKALLACVMKKNGAMSLDGTAFVQDKMVEIAGVFDMKYKGIKDEFTNKMWPACNKLKGTEGELAYNFLECVFKTSSTAKEVKDKFFSFFRAQQDR